MRAFLPTFVALNLAGLLAGQEPAAPHLFLHSLDALRLTRDRLARGDATLQPAYAHLLAEAAQALELRPPSVMDKPLTAASGDKHDYYSFGPYWWPDPAKPDGLPYIRRDGERNPAGNGQTDDGAFTQVCAAVETLGLAYWFTHDERYAAKAAMLTRVWFIDAATQMNPNLQHAQAIPGITVGRGIGIIESRRLMNLNEGLALLANSPAWTQDDRLALRAWLAGFYEWLRTSQNGLDEQGEHNNHGTWYDAQVAHLALVLGLTADAKQILTEGLTRRLASHVEPDGSQPHELARTKSMDYSIFNLKALLACARLAGHVGLDWWGYATPDGRSLRAAVNYLAPYANPAQAWPKRDIHEGRRSELLPLLDQFLHHREDRQLQKIRDDFATTVPTDSRFRLTNPSVSRSQP